VRDERVAVPIGSYHARYGVTLSLPSVIGRSGIVAVLEPNLSNEERQALERSADTLREAQRQAA
jgi:L-lactate dehydrogenase